MSELGKTDQAPRVEWDRAAVLAAMRAWAEEHGRAPTRRAWMSSGGGRHPHPQGGVVYRLFGSWPAALAAAALDVPTPGSARREGGWDPDAIIDAIIEWTGRTGQPPAVADWNPALARLRGETERAELFDRERPRWPTEAAVQHHCGTWNAALAAARQRTTQQGLKRDAPRPLAAHGSTHTPAWSAAETSAALHAHRAQHGRWPAYDDWVPRDPNGQRPTTRTVQRLFGSWSAALRAAADNHMVCVDQFPPVRDTSQE